MNQLINLFKNLIEIDSPSGEEKEISNFIFNYLKLLKLNPVCDKNNMVYCRIGNGPEPTLFCAHMDTVEPGRGISVIEDEGYLKSKGNTILGADNKSAVSAILYSVSNLISKNKDLNIELLFTVREETNSGISEFDYKFIESKRAYVFDTSDDLNKIIYKAPALNDFVIEIKGKKAHASKPEEGVSVIEILMNLQDKIKIGRLDKNTTFNIGKINGGISTNTVADYLRLEGDLRSTDQNLFEKYKSRLTKIIKETAFSLGGSADVFWSPYSFAYELDLKKSNFYQNTKLIYKNLNLDLIPVETKGGSDAGFLNYIGIETFCLGDGVISPHTTEERIKTSDLYNLALIVSSLMYQNNI